MQKYMDEFSYKFNTRNIEDYQRFEMSIFQVNCRLSYKDLVGLKVVKNCNKSEV